MQITALTPSFPQRTIADRVEQRADATAIRNARSTVNDFIAQRMESVAGSVEVTNAQRIGDSVVFTLKRVGSPEEIKATVTNDQVELTREKNLLFWSTSQAVTAAQAAGRLDMYM